MAFKPVSLIIPQYDEITYAGWWLKAYTQGTVTPLSMATDATGATTLVKCLLDSEGFPITSTTGPKFIPFIDGDYDLWMFPTEGEADGDITVNAIQLADNQNADPSTGGFLSSVVAIAVTTTITDALHRNALLECTSTITLDFTAAATLGAGFSTVAKNAGSGLITLDPDSAETINGVTTLVLGPGEWATITCDGVGLKATLGNNFGGRWIKGADVASAGALTLGADGNYFDITGTTAITSIVTRGVTGVIKLHFDGILTFTHHATNLILPGGANITTAAGDECELIEYGAGTYRVTNYQKEASFNFRGALVFLDANQSIPDATFTVINFDQEDYDTDSIHDNVTNNSRLTVPAGVTRIKLILQVNFNGNATGDRLVDVIKNGSSSYAGRPTDQRAPAPVAATIVPLTSAALTVVGGDYFELRGYQSSGGALNVNGEAVGIQTWFSMEIIE